MADDLLPIFQFVQLPIDHAHTWMSTEFHLVPDHEIPVQAVERTAVQLGTGFDIVATVLAVIRHLMDVIARSRIGFAGHQAAIGMHHHAQRIRQFYPCIGISIDRQIPLADLLRVYTSQ